VKATEVTAGLTESNGSLLLGLWRDSLHVTCGLTACTPGSDPDLTLGSEYGKTLPLLFYMVYRVGQKRGHRLMTIILSILNRFKTFFTGRFLGKFAVN